MKKVKLVIDTNVFLVSLAQKFRLHWIFESLVNGGYDLCISNDILTEYEEIIIERYGLEKTSNTLDFLLLLPNVKLISPHYKWNFLEDEDDNKFIDCYVASNADFIVSNDKGFNKVKKLEFPKINVISAEEFEIQFKSRL